MDRSGGRWVISASRIWDRLIWITTVSLFVVFYIADRSAYGSLILIGIAALLLLLMALRNHGKITIRLGMFHLLVLLFAGFCMISSFWAVKRDYAVTMATTIAEILICVSVPYWCYMNHHSSEPLLKAIMWGGFIVCLYTIQQYGITLILNILNRGSRLETYFTNINSIGMAAALSVIIAVHYWKQEGLHLSTVMILPAVLIVAVSTSRKALVLMAAGIILLLIIHAISENKLASLLKVFAVILLSIVGVCLLMSLPMFASVAKRMNGLLASITGVGKVDNSTLLRNEFTALGWRLFLQNPIFGVGISNPRYYNLYELGYNVYLHNNFAEMLAGGGIVGFCLYYSIYLYPLCHIVRNGILKNQESKLIFVMIVMLLAMDYGVVSYYSKDTYFYFMTFFQFISIQDRKGEM